MSTVSPSLTPAEAQILDTLHAHNYSPDCLHALGLSASDILAWSSSPAVAAALSALRQTLAALAHLSDLSRSHAARPLALDALSSVIATSDNLTQRRLAATSLLRTTSPPSPRSGFAERGEGRVRGSVSTQPHLPTIPNHPCERATPASAPSPACGALIEVGVTGGSATVTQGASELAPVAAPPPTPDAGPEKALPQRSGHQGTDHFRPSPTPVPATPPPRAPGRDAPSITPFPPRRTPQPVAALLARAGAPARPP